MLGKTKTSDTSQTGQRCLYPAPSLFSKNQLAKESPDSVAPVWPQWLCQPWPQLWISPSCLIGPVSVQSTVLLIGTGSQTEQ